MNELDKSIVARLEEALHNEKLSRGFAPRTTCVAEEDPSVSVPYLLHILATGDTHPQRRAAWICDWVSNDLPQAFEPHRQQLIDLLLSPKVGESAKRMIANTLLNMPIEEEIDGRLYSYCFDSMLSNKYSLGYRSSCAKLVMARARLIPELWQELQTVMTNTEGMDTAPSLRAVRKQVLKGKNKGFDFDRLT